jgi:hypothetical protein
MKSGITLCTHRSAYGLAWLYTNDTSIILGRNDLVTYPLFKRTLKCTNTRYFGQTEIEAGQKLEEGLCMGSAELK